MKRFNFLTLSDLLQSIVTPATAVTITTTAGAQALGLGSVCGLVVNAHSELRNVYFSGLHGIRDMRFNISPNHKLIVCEGNIGTFRPPPIDNNSSSSSSGSSSSSTSKPPLKKFAVVNAANAGLWSGSGVCGAIFSAAGHKPLQAACTRVR